MPVLESMRAEFARLAEKVAQLEAEKAAAGDEGEEAAPPSKESNAA